MLTRREFMRTAALLALAPHAFGVPEKEIWVNDVHSQLNRTRVRELLRPRTRDELAEIVGSHASPINCNAVDGAIGPDAWAETGIAEARGIDTRDARHRE